MGALELLFDYFEDHRHAAELITQRRPVGVGVLGFAVGALSLFVANAVADRFWFLELGWSSLLLVLLWDLSLGFIVASIVHLILDLGGVDGSGAGLFVHLGLAHAAWALIVPLALLVRLAAPGSGLAMAGAFFSVGILTILLKIRSIRDNYGITLVRAVVTFLLPYMAAFSAVAVAASLTAVIAVLKALG